MRFFKSRQTTEQANPTAAFEAALRPHLEAAYNLARWLMKNDPDAEDMVQDASIRALQAYGTFRGTNFRAWLLRIVRNTCYTRLKSMAAQGQAILFEDELHSLPDTAQDPAAIIARRYDARRLREAIEELPAEFREAIVLREMEDLSYREISEIAGIPLGTVMSRLARARQRLETALTECSEKYP